MFIKRIILNVINHLQSFWLPWLLLLSMLGAAFFVHDSHILLMVIVGLFFVVLCVRPMNIIYGLIGTRGDINCFFILFTFINLLFAFIYFFAFFDDAGITYDTNQPHVEFKLFESDERAECMALCSDGLESLPETCADSVHHYYHVSFSWVMRNTLLTSLMQEPTDFYSVSSTYTGVRQFNNDPNYDMAKFFHWFLIFHILVSWILLGVFISLVYQRFRKT